MDFVALHLWQSTLVLIAAWALAQLCRRNEAAVRHGVWFAASIKFLVPFAWLQSLGDYIGRSLPEPPPVSAALLETARLVFVPGAGLVGATPPHLEVVLWCLWAVGAAVLLLRWVLQSRAVRRLAAEACDVDMDGRASVRITKSDFTPAVIGVLRPVIVLPAIVVQRLDATQMHAVLAHEMHHVRRRDNLSAAVHKCVEVLFWFYPPVWWLGARLLREREAACDEAVVEQGTDAGVYAAAILSVCRLSVSNRFSGAAASTGGSLTERMRAILSTEHVQPISRARFAVLLIAAMAASYGPLAAGIVSGASREASSTAAITFDAITLAPSAPAWRTTTHFDEAGRSVQLANVSVRQLIELAYPASRVNSDTDLIDRAYYDIEARWSSAGVTSERHVYRQLLQKIVGANTNLELSVGRGCEHGCVRRPGQAPGAL